MRSVQLFICLLIPSTGLAQTEPGAGVRVENGVVSLPTGEVQVRADRFGYVDTSTVLTGNVVISVMGQGRQSTRVSAETARVETALTEVQITLREVSQFPEENATQVESILKAALQSPKFRISWTESFGSSGSSTTAVYTRQSRTLKQHIIRGWGENIEIQEFIFSGVEDQNILAVLFNPQSTSLPNGVERRTLRNELRRLPTR
jgi:hypothetical protein